jgi:hypothetical protein
VVTVRGPAEGLGPRGGDYARLQRISTPNHNDPDVGLSFAILKFHGLGHDEFSCLVLIQYHEILIIEYCLMDIYNWYRYSRSS